ncbi:hypothetical protein CLV49_1265 [Labedella gwakjiensis]|uniref:Uncharacterized protein n=1 Tax=Labedella gwakjiensis TaxID=390269 RepID=A0A2P8GUL8_9MICO|nr:hypothetical protein [Labedella gwakjiensis]PSL37658.1 hypothetical protein CLV49_1265 [Labedella gwakjiensis]RUQ87747.1 hypothetical protein ELQ93_12875 [Labedella gwakjiensis]
MSGAIRGLTVVSAGVLVGGLSLLATSAQAAFQPVPETGDPGRLVLLSDPYPAEFLDLQPGVVRYWQVTATIEGATQASLVLEVRKDGELVERPDGLVMTIERCDTAWTGVPDAPQCAAGRAAVASATPDDDYTTSSPVFDLDGVDADGTHLLVALSLVAEDSGDETLMGLEGDMGLGLTAAAVDPVTPEEPGRPSPPPGGGLAVTGVDPLGLILAAFGAVGLGAALLVSRARRSPALRTVGSEGASQLARPGNPARSGNTEERER